jgi:hypothetical protein
VRKKAVPRRTAVRSPGKPFKLTLVNERNLSFRLSTGIVDVLKARGHIAVAKGGAAALARELEDRMVDDIDAVAARLDPWRGADLEVTFVDDVADEQVDDLVGALARALLESDQVEDVFAEEAALRRELLRALRDGLLGVPRDRGGADEGPARVRLDALGYLAAVVARRARLDDLEDALERAAQSVGCKLNAYDPEAREATFSLSEATFSITVADPDARFDLEQSVADELAELVSDGRVTLPALERRVELRRSIGAATLGALRRRIDEAAAQILRGGASWTLEGDRTLRVTVTPTSDKDAGELGRRAAELAARIEALLEEAPAEEEKPAEVLKAAEAPAAAKKAAPKKSAKKAAPKKSAKKAAPKKSAKKAAPKKSAKKAAPKKSAKKKMTAKKAPRKTAAKKVASKKAAMKRRPATKAKRATANKAKKAAAKKPAAKRARGKKAAIRKAPSKKRR